MMLSKGKKMKKNLKKIYTQKKINKYRSIIIILMILIILLIKKNLRL